jgi:hypothetical protein
MKKRNTLETQSPRFEKMCEDIHDCGTRLRVSDMMGEKMPNYQSAKGQKADRGPCPRKRDGKDQEKTQHRSNSSGKLFCDFRFDP